MGPFLLSDSVASVLLLRVPIAQFEAEVGSGGGLEYVRI